MSDLPDEVRAATVASSSYRPGANMLALLRELRERGLILWASELRDEATIERAARALCRLYAEVPDEEWLSWDEQRRAHYCIAAEAALSAVLGSEEPRNRDLGEARK